MAQRVFVKVIGFTDVERHALNTVFRLSEQRETIYSLWLADNPEPPQLALIDGQSFEAHVELETPRNHKLKLIWVGAVAPAEAWRTFHRPISWPEVVNAMDQLFAPSDPLDFDLGRDSGMADTLPPDLPPVKRALIASADRDVRLYMRARLSLADLTQADEAETGAQALELTRAHAYAVALVDLSLPDVDGWAFVKELGEAKPGIEHLILTKAQPSFPEQIRAWLRGAKGLFGTRPDPGKLQALLERV
ncbi:response regulator [Ramlibacter sp. WS9]|uniref:response regulator n=1 Tax=Ramlibacter sp. WS9 TaxID=1882741 RepID=UPI00114388B8|nr:response regulator [Ramlibacter sp. WS9]ROZ77093.1 response regulator [Ramlibacter sp. WS9]